MKKEEKQQRERVIQGLIIIWVISCIISFVFLFVYWDLVTAILFQIFGLIVVWKAKRMKAELTNNK